MTDESLNSGPNYIAIIGDLRHSRRAEDRAELQRRLIESVRTLNLRLGYGTRDSGLEAPVAFTTGDEIQALMSESEGEFVVDVLEELSDAARPAEFSFGIGRGNLSTDLSESVSEIDGPAFHNARDSLDLARSLGTWAAVSGFRDRETDELISSMLALLGAVRGRWTDRQMEIMMAADDMRRVEVAKELGVSPSVVTESLQAAAAVPYQLGRQALVNLLSVQSQGAQ